jgi:4-hydroxy 2-oxovalerate aldolase
MKSKTQILDCTLRDGSYINNFQFSKKQTTEICSKLEKAGVEMIEVGHGMGMGASRIKKYQAKESDIVYGKAAEKSLSKSKWGMFCIPGIASLDDVKILKDLGASFIRVGSNVENYKFAEPFINLAKKLRMRVCSNFMKSYVLSPKKFSKIANIAHNMGSNTVYIVDSAGGMTPFDLESYYNEIKNINNKIKIGFHGHNNLGFAMANAFAAVKLNFDIVDASLQGYGRSAGNTAIELLVCSLKKNKIQCKIDYIKILNLSEEVLLKFIETKGIKSIDAVCGMSLFHSSYLPVIEKYSKIYRVDPRLLIYEVSKINKSEAPENLVKKTALKLKKNKKSGNWKKIYNHFYINEQSFQ